MILVCNSSKTHLVQAEDHRCKELGCPLDKRVLSFFLSFFTSPLLLSLVNFILKPKTEFRKLEHLRDHWGHCKRAHAILLDVLALFGPDIFNPLWNQFRYFELVHTKTAVKEQDDDYDQLDTEELKQYRDFWNFTDRLLNREGKDINAKVRPVSISTNQQILTG